MAASRSYGLTAKELGGNGKALTVGLVVATLLSTAAALWLGLRLHDQHERTYGARTSCPPPASPH